MSVDLNKIKLWTPLHCSVKCRSGTSRSYCLKIVYSMCYIELLALENME